MAGAVHILLPPRRPHALSARQCETRGARCSLLRPPCLLKRLSTGSPWCSFLHVLWFLRTYGPWCAWLRGASLPLGAGMRGELPNLGSTYVLPRSTYHMAICRRVRLCATKDKDFLFLFWFLSLRLSCMLRNSAYVFLLPTTPLTESASTSR